MGFFSPNFLNFIGRIPAWIKGFLPFITAIVGLVKLWQGDTTLVTIVLLAVGILSGMYNCAYVAFKRTPPLIEGGKGVLQYPPRWRRLALYGCVILFLLVIGGLGYYVYEQTKSPTKVLILVADFGGPEPQNYRVTEAILEQLRDATKNYSDVEVKAWAQLVTVQQGSNFARKMGKKHKAGIVLWGWYGKTQEKVLITAYFDVLRPPSNLSLRQDKETMQAPVADLESFAIQEHLSSKMSYLTLLTIGLARYEKQDYDGAIDRFSEALRYETPALMINPAIIYLYRGNAHNFKTAYDHAIRDYTQSIELQPDNFLAYNNRGFAYAQKGEYKRALADFDYAIKLKSDLVPSYVNRGNIHKDQGNNDLAIADYNRALKLQPDYALVYSNRGSAYYNKGDYKRAIADYDHAIKIDSSLVLAYNNRGNAYRDKGDYNYGKAFADYNKAIKIDPNSPLPYYNRGITYYRQGAYDLAIADYDRAILLKPDFALAYNNRGNAYQEKGDYNQAIVNFTHCITLRPDLVPTYYNRGLAYRFIGDRDSARSDFKKVLELTKDPDLYQAAARQLVALGIK